MRQPPLRLLAFTCLALFLAPSPAPGKEPAPAKAVAKKPPPKVPDSLQLEKSLQGLEWEQFRSVVEAIPPIRAEVEKRGSAGWQYVKLRYRTHAWRKNIDRLSDDEKRQLAQLIQNAGRKR